MIVLGLILLLVGWFVGIPILYWIGGLLLIVGAVLLLLGPARTGGHRYW